MQISGEGKIGIGIALFGLLGAGANFIGAGSIAWLSIGLGALTLLVAIAGGAILAMHHFSWSLLSLWKGLVRHKWLSLGMSAITLIFLFGPLSVAKIYTKIGDSQKTPAHGFVESRDASPRLQDTDQSASIGPQPFLSQTAYAALKPPPEQQQTLQTAGDQLGSGNCPPGYAGLNIHGLDIEDSHGPSVQMDDQAAASTCMDGVKILRSEGPSMVIGPDAAANQQSARPQVPARPKLPQGK